MSKCMLVTGGAGFIGSNFVKYILSKEAYKIINIDALTYAGNLENLKEIEENENYIFIKGDITDKVLMKKIFQDNKVDYVVNFAAESHVDRSIEDSTIFVKTNVMGTQVLLEAAKNNWQIGLDGVGYPIYKEGVKYLQVSTDEVYGALGKTGLFTEETPIAPNSPYASSKASADLMVRAYGKTYNFPMNITRCSNNYGPYQFPEKLIPLMISNALENKKLPIYGDGCQVRDWLHVEDHCSAIECVLKKGLLGEVYNIGGNNEKRNIEIVTLILKELGKDVNLITYVKDRLSHDQRYAIDNTKITTELGWTPSYKFEEGIKETIEWYVNHEAWLSRVKSEAYRSYYEKMYTTR